MDFVNEFWLDINNRTQTAPAFDFESDFSMPSLSVDSGYDFSFDFDDLDVRIDDDCFKSILGAAEECDSHSLESSMSSDVSVGSGSPSPLSMEGSKTPYSDATQCRRPSSNGHIRRPMNPFMVFAKEERRRMSAVTPNLHNAEISKICGRKWKNMTAEEKRPFELESARLKVLHEKEYPGYKYKPQKKTKVPAIKKRPTSERTANKTSLKKLKVQQPLRHDQDLSKDDPKSSSSSSSYLMVNGQKIPLKTAKSTDNKNTFNLQLKIDENYKIVPANPVATASPILQILPPVQVKQENVVNPVYVSFPGSPNDLSFSPFFMASGDPDKKDHGVSNAGGLFLLINCPNSADSVNDSTCIYSTV